MLRLLFALVILFATQLFSASIHAQSPDSPVDHMNALTDKEELLSKKYLTYMSEVAHGERARRMEKRREDLINSVRDAIHDAGRLRPYKGDASLRDAFKAYWSVLLSVFTEEYHKIVDMEEVAEQSYDAMEAYLLIQEKATQKLDTAYSRVPETYQAFADKHGVKLVEGQKSKISRKLDQAGIVNKYLNQLYLIFFKSYVQEQLMLKGLNEKDINAVEQSKNSMAKYAAEGLSRLDTVKTFKGDGSLITACRKVLDFQKAEAEKISVLTEFLIKNEEFEKIKKSYDTKPPGKRTQSDVDAYNKAVTGFNSAVNANNKVNTELNTGRSKVLNNWNTSRKRFMDSHMPHK